MKLHILAIGRLKAGPELELLEDYTKRARGIGRSCGITGLETRDFAESKLPDAQGRMVAEASLLTGACPSPCFSIVLDERGKSLSSDDFAALLRRHLDQGTPSVAFLIGGPDSRPSSVFRSDDLAASAGTSDAG